MKIGYLPDTFGFNAQMPILLKHVGLDNIFFGEVYILVNMFNHHILSGKA